MTLEEIARRQHRVVRAAQALAAGLTKSDIARLTRSGEWQRLFRGVYALEPLTEAPFVVRCRGALLFAGDGSAISHLSTLELIAGSDGTSPVHITVAGRDVVATQGLQVHWTTQHSVLTVVRGVLSVPPAAAVVGAWSTTDDEDARLAMLCHAALDLRIGPDAVRDALARPIRIRHRRALERACELVALGCHSALEIRYHREVEVAFGLPAPRRQVEIRVGSGVVHRVDVLYDAARLVIELDGEQHRTPEGLRADRLRDAELRAAGLRVLRFTWSDVVRRPWWVAATVRSVLAEPDFGRGEVRVS